MALVTGGANPVLRSPRIKRPVFKSDILQQEIKTYNSFGKVTNHTTFHKGLIFLTFLNQIFNYGDYKECLPNFLIH